MDGSLVSGGDNGAVYRFELCEEVAYNRAIKGDFPPQIGLFVLFSICGFSFPVFIYLWEL